MGEEATFVTANPMLYNILLLKILPKLITPKN